jgi:hypothetical protein
MTEYTSRTLPELEEFARRRGCRLLVARTNQLFLDIDLYREKGVQIDDQYRLWLRQYLPILASLWKDARIKEVYQSIGGGMHIIIELPHPTEQHRAILFQAALGSDPLREFNLLREWLSAEDALIVLCQPTVCVGVVV